MSKIKSKGIMLIALIAITLIIISPISCIEATLKGLRIWAINVVPALFPFFILTRIIITLNQTSIPALDKLTAKCFHTPNSGIVYFLSVLSGYPVGAKIISSYYQMGAIDKATATKMFSFCSTSGPMFIIGTVGIGVFADAKIGYILLIGHIIGSFINGMIYRGKSLPTNNFKSNISKSTLNEIMYDSINSILLVGGYIIFSSLIIELLQITSIIPTLSKVICAVTNFDINVVNSALCGIIEITNGLIMLGETNISVGIKVVLASILISFSGICIMLQSSGFLNQIGIKKSTILIQKVSQSIVTCLITLLLVLLFL